MLTIAIISVCAAWYFTDHILTWLGAPTKSDERGQFGDMYGSINTLFSGLAFAFLVANTYMQSRQLSMQQEELALTRAEISAQLDQMKEQSNIFHRQVSDSILFKLIDALQAQANLVQGHTTHYITNEDGLEDEYYETKDGRDGFSLIMKCTQTTLFSIRNRSDINAELFTIDLGRAFHASVKNTNALYAYISIFKEITKITIKNNNDQLPLIRALLSNGERFSVLIFLFLKDDFDTIEMLNKNSFFHDMPGFYNSIKRVICIKTGKSDPGPAKK